MYYEIWKIETTLSAQFRTTSTLRPGTLGVNYIRNLQEFRLIEGCVRVALEYLYRPQRCILAH